MLSTTVGIPDNLSVLSTTVGAPDNWRSHDALQKIVVQKLNEFSHRSSKLPVLHKI